MQAVVLLGGASKAFFLFCFGIEHVVHSVVEVRRSFAQLERIDNHRVLSKQTLPHSVLVLFLP